MFPRPLSWSSLEFEIFLSSFSVTEGYLGGEGSGVVADWQESAGEHVFLLRAVCGLGLERPGYIVLILFLDLGQDICVFCAVVCSSVGGRQ